MAEPDLRFQNGSRILTRIMLGMTMVLLGYALISVVSIAKTYLFSLLAALFCVAVYIFVVRRLLHGKPLPVKSAPLATCLLISLLFFALNLPVVFAVPVEPRGDYYMFWQCANDLLNGTELKFSYYVALFPHILGYAKFLSVVMAAFGSSTTVAAVTNVVLTAASGVMIFYLVLRWRNIESASFAYLLWALCPSKLLYNTQVLSEPLYTALALLFLVVVSAVERKGSGTGRKIPWGVLAGVACGLILSVLNAVRPVAAVFIIAFFIWLLLLRGDKLKDRSLWTLWLGFAVLMLGTYFAACGMWKGYVADTTGQESYGIPAYNLYVGFNPETNGLYSNEDAYVMDQYIMTEDSAADVQKQMLKLWKERLNSGEINFPKLFTSKLSNFLGYDEGGAYYMQKELSPLVYTVFAGASNVFYYVLIMLTLMGLAALFKRGDTSCVLIIPMYALGLSLAHMLVEVSSRYHYSIIPMLVIVAAFSWESRWLQGGRKAAAGSSET